MSAAAYLPDRLNLKALREAAEGCHGCDLYRHATQTVFGVGPAHARAVIVGEQPGDTEDRVGIPLVGPTGKFFDQVLDEVGIDRGSLYLTGAVKHFAFVERGKRRIHRTPKKIEVKACLPWLEAELRVIKPDVAVALGATAAYALLGPGIKVTEKRGQLVPSRLGPQVLITVHPASVLRAPDEAARRVQRADFVDDLRLLAELLAAPRAD